MSLWLCLKFLQNLTFELFITLWNFLQLQMDIFLLADLVEQKGELHTMGKFLMKSSVYEILI